jgi:hypothetical protein
MVLGILAKMSLTSDELNDGKATRRKEKGCGPVQLSGRGVGRAQGF